MTRWCLLVLLAAGSGRLEAQPAPAGQPDTPGQVLQQGLPLPKDDMIVINRNTTKTFQVDAPYGILPTVYSEREEIASIEIVRPAGELINRLPNSFILTSYDPIGSTTIQLQLAKQGEPPISRRIEVLVIDEISEVFKKYIERQISQTFPTANVKLVIPNARTVVLTGFVERAEEITPIEDLVRGLMAAREGGTQQQAVAIVNALRISGAQQVQMKVLIAEINRTRLRSLGLDWTWTDLGTGLVGSLANVMGAAAATPGNNVSFTVSRAGQFTFSAFLQALSNATLAKILAEPVVVATSGQPAFFLAGGEFPITTAQASGGTIVFTTEFRDFGTNLRVVPTVLGSGRVRLEIRPENSQRVRDVATANGGTAPEFSTRVVETTVELENGQTLILAGLVQSRISSINNKVPVIGDLPLVGWAFRHKQYTQEETELLIMVTPHLADALDETPCKLPGRESRIPNDLEFYLGSKFEPPCFEDPYREPWRRHFDDAPAPVPVPVAPYDNYGKPPAPPATEVKVERAHPTNQHESRPPVAPAVVTESTAARQRIPALPPSARPAPAGVAPTPALAEVPTGLAPLDSPIDMAVEEARLIAPPPAIEQ